jgi:hypothetical protein
MRGVVAVAAAVVLLVAGCSDDDGGATDGGPSGSAATEPGVDGCDDLDETACLLPFPNDAFTEAADTDTGRRLALPEDGMPTNEDGTPIDPADMNRADGFSPGSAPMVRVPGLDVEHSGIAPTTDIGSSLDDDAPIVVVDAGTGERVPYWAELDAQAETPDEQLLMIHPAIALTEGHRILVGLRDLKGQDGQAVEPSPGWEQVASGELQPTARREHLQAVETELDDHVGGDEDWWMAWDFTVASEESLSGRLRHIRDAAYEELGDGAPAFAVESAEGEGVRTIRGTYEVPSALTSPDPGGRFALDDQGVPRTGQGTFTARFVCVVPDAPDEPALPVVYGHGLLGSAEEVESLAVAVPLGNLAACATDWVGMASTDLPNVAEILGDLSDFPELADRLQQGHVNMSFLGRLLNHPDGLASDPAFQDAEGNPVFDVGATEFVGNSQGGILGGAASAVSTEWDRAVLGVPGMGYSLLLPRSIDWDEFAPIFTDAYTDHVEQVIALALVQLLWDRGENQGYAQHLTGDPYPGMEAKDVLLIEAFGDHQVSNVSTEILARTIGARAHLPALEEGRSPVEEPLWGVEPLGNDRTGPALVLWDFGTPAPPTVNEAPRSPEYGDDPHGAGVEEPLVLAQAFGFLRDGRTEDVCAGGPCTSDAG